MTRAATLVAPSELLTIVLSISRAVTNCPAIGIILPLFYFRGHWCHLTSRSQVVNFLLLLLTYPTLIRLYLHNSKQKFEPEVLELIFFALESGAFSFESGKLIRVNVVQITSIFRVSSQCSRYLRYRTFPQLWKSRKTRISASHLAPNHFMLWTQITHRSNNQEHCTLYAHSVTRS